MGQAKLRRQQQQEETAGAPVPDGGRRMPPPGEFLRRHEQLLAADRRGERPSAVVPCQTCTACCRNHQVLVIPGEERAEDLWHLDLEPAPQGWLLRHNSDGSCVHLGDQGCTVYPHRPRACRLWDCRLFSLAGVADYPGPHWVPRIRHEADRRTMAALVLARTRVDPALGPVQRMRAVLFTAFAKLLGSDRLQPVSAAR